MAMQIILSEGNNKICFDLKSLAGVSFEINDNVNKEVDDKLKILTDMINNELDLIGINYRLKGREYIIEAILYLLTEENKTYKYVSFYQYLSDKHNLMPSSINRAIQTSINDAWRNIAMEDIEKNYTVKFSYNRGVPTATEFIYFYVEKLKKNIQIE